LFLLHATDVHFHLGGKKLCLSSRLQKQDNAIFFSSSEFPGYIVLPDRASTCITPSTVRTMYLHYSPKPQYCRLTALNSYKLVMAFLIWHCLMLYAEHQSAGCYSKWLSGNSVRSMTRTPVTVLLPFQEESEWWKTNREKLALISRWYNNKKDDGNFFVLHHWNVENSPLLKELKIRADNLDQTEGKWWWTE